MYARRFDTFEDQLAYELKQKSRQEGLQEGRQQTLRDTLTRLLEREGGALPSVAVERLSVAGADQLQQWLDQVIARQRPTALLEP